MSKMSTVITMPSAGKRVSEYKLNYSQLPTHATFVAAAPVAHVVPADRPKIIIAVGPGRTGKSTGIRFIAERAMNRGSVIGLATVAPNRTLQHFFKGTLYPEGGLPADGARFIDEFISATVSAKASSVIDLPGDDASLPLLLSQGVDLPVVLEETGYELVVLYFFSPRVEDLTALARLTDIGFTPKATALILNEGLTSDITQAPRPFFDDLTSHSVYRAAIDRGAAQIWMPRHYAAATIENLGILFSQSRDHAEVGLSDKSRTHQWLLAMGAAFAPIASWLP
jgi:hypothetical protein